MGAKMEYDMRNDIFDHYQKLSFNFYDNQKVGQLMTRVTNDLFETLAQQYYSHRAGKSEDHLPGARRARSAARRPQ